MKPKLLILLFTATLYGQAQAGWFSKDPVPDYKDKIIVLENEIKTQGQVVDRWQLIAASLGIACSLFFITGTALGAKTRKHYDGSRRMGFQPNSTTYGNEPPFVAQEDEVWMGSALAAYNGGCSPRRSGSAHSDRT